MGIGNFITVAAHELNNVRIELFGSAGISLTPEEELIVNKISSQGYCVIENAYSLEWCEKVKQEIDTLIDTYGDKVWQDDAKSDMRVFGANNLSDPIKEFYENESTLRVVQSYEKALLKDGFTMAARLTATENNLGSGGGWHRDSPLTKQTKAILYLSDVEEQHGPFQYIDGSHRIKDIYNKKMKYGFKLGQNRFSNEEIDPILDDGSTSSKTFSGKAGTLILVDTRGIHRGMPIQQGQRYALTNYLWFHSNVPAHVEKMVIKN